MIEPRPDDHLLLMRLVCLVTVVVLLCSGLAGFGAERSRPSSGNEPNATSAVQRTNYLGSTDAYVLAGSNVKAVVLPSSGGRIVQYSWNGQNILADARMTAGQGDTRSSAIVGGYQCFVGPAKPGLAPLERLISGRYESLPSEEFGVTLRSEVDSQRSAQLEKEIIIDPESGELGITQRLRNVGTTDSAFFLQDKTVCPGGGFAFFPVKKKSVFPAKWSLARLVGNQTTFDGKKPQSANVKLLNGVLVAKCDGDPTRLGADSDAGWIAYVRGRLLFVKYFPFSPKGRYPDGGNSVQLYFDTQIAELGPCSPEIKLRKGEAYDFPEKWSLVELDSPVSSFAEARNLMQKVASSPFE